MNRIIRWIAGPTLARLESENELYRNALLRWDKKLELIEKGTKKLIKAHQQSQDTTRKLMRQVADYDGLQSRLFQAENALQSRDNVIDALKKALAAE